MLISQRYRKKYLEYSIKMLIVIWEKKRKDVEYISYAGKKYSRRFIIDGKFKDWQQWQIVGNPAVSPRRWALETQRGIERKEHNVSEDTEKIIEHLPVDEKVLHIKEYDVEPFARFQDYNDKTNIPFRPALEYYFHDTIHMIVGRMSDKGQETWGMGSLASPNDPLFYLHHCNLDRIWAKWQVEHGFKYAPENGGPPGHNLKDDMEGLPSGIRFKRPIHALDYVNVLKYKYDDVAYPGAEKNKNNNAQPSATTSPHSGHPANAALANAGAVTPGLPGQNQQPKITNQNALV